MAEQCLFCAISHGKIPALIVSEDKRTISFMDISPATRGHTLVIPREHATDIHSINQDDLFACIKQAQRLANRMIERLKADGVSLINSNGRAAWQSVFHFHIHVIPRYKGDPLQLPWIPKEGDKAEIEAVAALLRR